MSEKGWIGVDFDGTLVTYDGWKGVGHIGEPVPAMVERVKAWLAEGKEVRIFTARVWVEGRGGEAEAQKAREQVQDWCEVHLGRRLAVTNVKDFGMTELWDDRAVQVEKNKGKRADDVGEERFRQALAVFREYLFDLDSDIEGCNADELTEIEHMSEATRELRRRFVAHVTEGADTRGMLPCSPCAGADCQRCKGWALVRPSLPAAMETKP